MAKVQHTAKIKAEEHASKQVSAADHGTFAVSKQPPFAFSAANYEESGDKEITLFECPPGSCVTKAVVRVTGVAFQGKLRFLQGVQVTVSPVVYDTNGKQQAPTRSAQAFIIDFTGIRSVMGLEILNDKAVITLVLPWMGTEFSPKALYPVTSSDGSGQFLPKADNNGQAVVAWTGAETTKLLVQIKPGGTLLEVSDFLGACRIITATYPSNVKASVNERLPFWTHPGILNDTVEVTGLVEDLNTLLKDASEETEKTKVRLMLTSDTPGVLLVDFDEAEDLEVNQSAHARWGNQTMLDVAMEALESQSVALAFPATTAKSWLTNRITLDLAGRFPNWQAYSEQEDDIPGKLGMKISAQFSVARRFMFDESGELYGFSLLVRPCADPVEIRVEVVTEKDERPDAGKPLATADASVSAESQVSTSNVGPSRWTDILFDSPATIEAGKGMWLVVKTKTGTVECVGSTAPPTSHGNSGAPTTVFNTKGGPWQHYPLVEGGCPVAQMRVLRRPFTQENKPLLKITWNGIEQSIDVSEDIRTVELGLPGDQTYEVSPADGTVLIPLVMVAAASGTLTIKEATALYEEKST